MTQSQTDLIKYKLDLETRLADSLAIVIAYPNIKPEHREKLERARQRSLKWIKLCQIALS